MGAMKTTIELPDDLFRQTKATAALRGESLKDFVTGAVRARLESERSRVPPLPGWRSVFGGARPEEVGPVDAKIAEELGQIDAREWA